jgi:plastocyanin
LLLKSLSLFTMLLLGSVSVNADTARAEERVVIILSSAYFPRVTAVEDGDTIRFVNMSGTTHTVTSSAGLWTTGPIDEGDEHALVMTPEMTGKYFGLAEKLIEGQFDFVRAP